MFDLSKITLAGLTASQLDSLYWKMGLVLDRIEDLIDGDPCTEPSRTYPGTLAYDLTAIGEEFNKLREDFFLGRQRIIETLLNTQPTAKYEVEIRHERLLIHAAESGESMEAIAAMATNFGKEQAL